MNMKKLQTFSALSAPLLLFSASFAVPLRLFVVFMATMTLFAFGTVNAATLTLVFDNSFGADAPDGTDWFTAFFDETAANEVTLTMTVAGTIGNADISEAYFNLDPNYLALLTITHVSGDVATVSTASDNFQADGDGLYDILFDFPEAPPRFSAGDTSVYTLSGAGLLASSFNFLSTPNDGGSGPFLAAAHVLETGPLECDPDFTCPPHELENLNSDWISPSIVPVPAAAWMFGSALGLLGWVRRKTT
jgi:hypothetical protein